MSLFDESHVCGVSVQRLAYIYNYLLLCSITIGYALFTYYYGYMAWTMCIFVLCIGAVPVLAMYGLYYKNLEIMKIYHYCQTGIQLGILVCFFITAFYLLIVNSFLYIAPNLVSSKSEEEMGKDAFVALIMFVSFFVNGFFGWNVSGRARLLIEHELDGGDYNRRLMNLYGSTESDDSFA